MDMAALYQKHKLPFVMGTTGGDREKLLRDTEVRAQGAAGGAGSFAGGGRQGVQRQAVGDYQVLLVSRLGA
jgi:hypothetical protein